jgi:hypothetical protein
MKLEDFVLDEDLEIGKIEELGDEKMWYSSDVLG